MKLLIAIALVALAAGTVDAGEPDERTATEASAHFDRGVALVKRGDQLAALAEFEAAYALVPDWAFLFNIGVTEKALFRYGPAIHTLEQYLAEGGAQITKDRRTKVEAELAELRRLVAEVVVTVEGGPARIEVDELAAGESPLAAPLLVAPGEHTIRAIRDGELPDEKTVSVVSGDRVEVTLSPHPAPPEVTTATITIVTRPPGATLRIDDEPATPAPWTGALSAGSHRVRAELSGYQVERTDLQVFAGQERTVPIELVALPPPPRHRPPLYRRRAFWIAIGAVGLAAGVSGVVYLAQPEAPDVALHW